MNQPYNVTYETTSETKSSTHQEHENDSKDECDNDIKSKTAQDEIDRETNTGENSCFATCTASDVDDDILKGYSCSYDADEHVEEETQSALTNIVGTRWFRAPELLFGSTNYSFEVDLWSLGCVFAELFILEAIFPGVSDIDQLGRIFAILGNLTEDVFPGCSKLPDYGMIHFGKVENPIGLESRLSNRSLDEISIVKRLLCFDPNSRSSVYELLNDKYFGEEPIPYPVSKLYVPSSHCGQDEDYIGNYNGMMGSDSDSEEFGSANITHTKSGFFMQFP